MGKYMRKSKGTGGVALMEVSHSHTQPSLGVRTRARTLALERLQTSSSSSSSAAATAAAEGLEGEGEGGSGSYLQLRNRRLEKVSPIVLDGKRQKLSQLDTNLQQKSPSSGMKDTEENKEAPEPEEEEVKECLRHEKIEGAIKMKDKESRGSGGDLGVEETTSFGENVLEFGGRERSRSRSWSRSRRESTPCSLIRDADAIRTPGSSTRNIRVVTPRNRENLAAAAIIPAAAAEEMEAFFSRAEELQQRKFVDKYNFDPVSDRPLPGPYEWEKLNH